MRDAYKNRLILMVLGVVLILMAAACGGSASTGPISPSNHRHHGSSKHGESGGANTSYTPLTESQVPDTSACKVLSLTELTAIMSKPPEHAKALISDDQCVFGAVSSVGRPEHVYGPYIYFSDVSYYCGSGAATIWQEWGHVPVPGTNLNIRTDPAVASYYLRLRSGCVLGVTPGYDTSKGMNVHFTTVSKAAVISAMEAVYARTG